MPSIRFHKIIPSGNATIILTEADAFLRDLPAFASQLMHPMHLQAEQVGLLSLGGALPHLQMMGGEFCINAARSAALVLARAGRLAPLFAGCCQGFLSVSGASQPLHVLVGRDPAAVHRGIGLCLEGGKAPDDVEDTPLWGERKGGAQEGAWGGTARMICAARMECAPGALHLTDVAEGACLVRMPGIAHLLLDAERHPFSDGWQRAASRWRAEARIDEEPASGVVWYTRTAEGYSIKPAVLVRETCSEYLETACGSASFALACLHRSKHPVSACGPGHTLPLAQLSGETIEVTLLPGGAAPSPVLAYVSGEARLVAEGVAHLFSSSQGG